MSKLYVVNRKFIGERMKTGVSGLRAWIGHYRISPNTERYSTWNGEYRYLRGREDTWVYGMLRFRRIVIGSDLYWSYMDFGAEMAVVDGVLHREIHLGSEQFVPPYLPSEHEFTTTIEIRVEDASRASVPDEYAGYNITQWGTFLDHETGLECFFINSDRLSFERANIWVANLDVAGGGWRIPTIREMAKLNHSDSFLRNEPMSVWSAWTSDPGPREGTHCSYDFSRNGTVVILYGNGSSGVFAVREYGGSR